MKLTFSALTSSLLPLGTSDEDPQTVAVLKVSLTCSHSFNPPEIKYALRAWELGVYVGQMNYVSQD